MPFCILVTSNIKDFAATQQATELCHLLRVERASFEIELLKLQADNTTTQPFSVEQWRKVQLGTL